MSFLIRKEFAGAIEFAVIKLRGHSFDPDQVSYVRRVSRATRFKDRHDAERVLAMLNGTTTGSLTIMEVPD